MDDRLTYRLVPVTSLPAPHNAFRCRYAARHKALQGEHERMSDELEQEVGHTFLATLTNSERAQCRFHQADWPAIAESAANILDQLGGDPDPDLVAEEVDRTCLPKSDSRWLFSLFGDPISIGPHGKRFTNGQHRACALRFSGYAYVVVAD